MKLFQRTCQVKFHWFKSFETSVQGDQSGKIHSPGNGISKGDSPAKPGYEQGHIRILFSDFSSQQLGIVHKRGHGPIAHEFETDIRVVWYEMGSVVHRVNRDPTIGEK